MNAETDIWAFRLQHRAACSEAAATVAAGAAEVPWVGQVGGLGSVALSPVLSVILAVRTIVPSSQLFLRGRATVRSRTGRPSSLPARQAGVIRIHLGLQEVQQRHGQLQVGALVAMHGVILPALVQAIHQVAHPAVLLP
jgi:hypothetical protein